MNSELCKKALEKVGNPNVLVNLVSRRVRHFPVTPMVDLRPDERGTSHVLTLVASDRPGLLYGVARILAAHRIDLRTAKINTLGDRGEDVFLVSGDTLRDEKSVLQLEQELLAELQLSEQKGTSVPR